MRSSASSNRARAVARSGSGRGRWRATRRAGPARGGGVGRRDARADRASVAELEANAPVRDADAMVVRAMRERRCAAETEGDERARGRIESSGALEDLRRAPRRCLRVSSSLCTHRRPKYSSYGGQSRFLFSVATWRPGKILREPLGAANFSGATRPPPPDASTHTRRAGVRRSQPGAFSATRVHPPRSTLARQWIADARHHSRTNATLSVAAASDLRAHVRHVRRRGRSAASLAARSRRVTREDQRRPPATGPSAALPSRAPFPTSSRRRPTP